MMLAVAPQLVNTIIPAGLVFAGLYLLLPRPRQLPRFFGAALLITGMIVGIRRLSVAALDVPTVEWILFWSFSVLAILGAVQLVTQSNPARGAVAFALVVMSVCGLFLLCGAPFLAAGTIIIYAGAIVVTFLFVIMLCQQHGGSDADARSREPLLACVAGAVLLGLFFSLIGRQYDPEPIDRLIRACDATLAATTPKLDEVDGEMRRFPTTLPLRERLEKRFDATLAKVSASSNDPQVVRSEVEALRAFAVGLRSQVGDILPPAQVKLSPFGGSSADRRLASGNVAGMGRVLFTEHMIGVEMAGTLLLVATIGAIAITYRTGRKPA